MEILEEIKSFLGDDENNESNVISPYPLLTKNAVESLRYRAEVIVLIPSLNHITSILDHKRYKTEFSLLM